MTDEFKSFSEIPIPQEQSVEPVIKRKPYHERMEKVIGGEIRWKPIDLQAARLLMSSPWYCKPLEIPNMQPNPNDYNQPRIRTQKIPGSDEPLLYKSDVSTVSAIASEKATQEALAKTAELKKRADEACDAICFAARRTNEELDEFLPRIAQQLESVRQTRFAIEHETHQVLSQFKEIRQFFLDEKHETEVERLTEFVGLCERLKFLKESGFLDVIADTILKL